MQGERVLIGALASVFLAACASTAPRPSFAGPLEGGLQISRRDILSVRVDARPSVGIAPRERREIAQQISRDIQHFQRTDPAAGAWRPYEITVRITKYSGGGRNLRAASIDGTRGLIGATVQVFSLPQYRLKEAFALSQVSLRGGMFREFAARRGAAQAFAEDIAQVLMSARPGHALRAVGLVRAAREPVAADLPRGNTR